MIAPSFPDKAHTLIICGPTSSGKTSIALQLAKELKSCNILSADSRQMYQGLDLLTGKDTPQDLSPSIKVFGQGITPKNEEANVSFFRSYAQSIITSSQNTKTPLIVVGGTGLYLKSLWYPYDTFSTPPDLDLRSKLQSLSVSDLQKKLAQIDNLKFSSLNQSDRSNPRRLIRAIEVGQSPSAPKITPLLDSFIFIGITPPPNLFALIHQRVISRLESGVIEEVLSYEKNNPHPIPSKTSLGYQLILDYTQDKIPKEDLIDRWTRSDYQYAKRQMVWFKKQPGIIWYDKDKALKEIKKNYLKQIQYA